MPDPCIRCGQCETVCPVNLQPQFLHAAVNAQAWDQVEYLNLDACLFCQACTIACPSHIPLRDQFIAAETMIKELENKRQSSLQSKKRFDARESRLARKNQLQESQRLAKLNQVTVDEKQTAIAAALARAQWKYDDV